MPSYPTAVLYNHTAERGALFRRDLMAWPQSLFRAEGLWLWGATEDTLLHNVKVGNQPCCSISTAPLPGLFFEAGMSFADFEQLLASPRAEWTQLRLAQLPEVPQHQKIRMLTAEVGNSMTLDVSGPLTHAVAWGSAVL